MKIITLTKENDRLIQQAAQLLVDAFREHWADAWASLEEGLQEINEMLEAERICRASIDDDGNLLGIIGGVPQYDGHVWELHPLAVQPSMQGRGIGKTLVEDFEEQVCQRGGLTVTLGSDDEDNMTSLSNTDLYENLWQKIRYIRNFKRHPFEFYQKMGYVITGVVPDANGVGKPDIIMSKESVEQENMITKEQEFLSFMNANRFAYQRIEHPAVFTCAEADLHHSDVAAISTKNLFLCDKKGRRFFLAVTACEKSVNLDRLSSQLGISRLKFGSEENLLRLLGVTRGSVTMMGLANDTEHQVELWMDDDIWQGENFLCHPLVNTATLVISKAELKRFFELTGHTPNFFNENTGGQL